MNGWVRKPIGLEEVLNQWDCGFLEGLDDVAGTGGKTNYCVGRVIRTKGSRGKLFAQHGELIPHRQHLTLGVNVVHAAHLDGA